MTFLNPNHNYAADECFAQIPQHHIPTQEEKVRASETFDKSVLVSAHMAALHDAYIMEMATHPVNEVSIKPASPTSSIGGLKPTTLKQLKVGKVHRRRVLNGSLCSRTLCTKTCSGVTVVNVLEDEEGNAIPIHLSNAIEGNGGSAQAQRYYPQDSKVAVKEPYLTRLSDGEIVLLVEKMTDLVFLWVPDYVEDDAGSQGKGVSQDVVGVDELPGSDSKDDGNHNIPANRDDLKNSRASRELNFDEMLNSKGSADDQRAEEARSSSTSRELKFDETLSEKGGADTVDSQDEVKRNEDISSDALARSSDDVNGVGLEDGANQTSSLELKDTCEESKVAESDTSNIDVNIDIGQKAEVNSNGGLKVGDDEGLSVGLEEARSSNTSRELKFDETLSRNGGADNLDSQGDVKREDDISSDALARSSDVINGIGLEDGADLTSSLDLKDTFEEIKVAENDISSRDLNIDIGQKAEVSSNGGLKFGDGEDNKSLEVQNKERETVISEREASPLQVVNEGHSPSKHADAGEAAASLRLKGNALFVKGDYNKATEMYRRGAEKARLDNLKEEEVLCLSNRAEVWLRLCRNQTALDDAEAALKLLREIESDARKGDLAIAKALFRKGRALMGLHKYEDAMRVLQEVLARAPADRQLREAAIRCRDRLQRVLKPGKRQRAAMLRRKSGSYKLQ